MLLEPKTCELCGRVSRGELKCRDHRKDGRRLVKLEEASKDD